MEALFEGVKEFNAGDFHQYEELYRQLSKKQNPHTLFIGCSDSRVVPNLITKTMPGELFVIRNIANLVPPFRASTDYLATTSAIEYALKILQVKNIVICGHSNCGGCNALYSDEENLKYIPYTRKWLELAMPVVPLVKIIMGSDMDTAKREWMTEQLNIVEQMNHLLSYPYIEEMYKSGDLKIYGWYYMIETGEIFNYDATLRRFVKIE